jgi:WD40 repeat protein
MAAIFVSYARRDDASFVKNLYADLVVRGFDVWLDKERMESRGRTFLQEIRDAGREIDRFILVIGPRAAESEYVRFEWRLAEEQCTVVVPILRLGDYSLVPKPFAKLHAIDFRRSRSYNEALAELLRTLKATVPSLGRVHDSVDQLPRHFIPRPEELELLRATVQADVLHATVITTAKRVTTMQGMGGVGKSVLAAAFARSCETLRSFKHVAWVKLQAHPDLTASLRSLGESFGDLGAEYYDLESAKKRLADVLRDKECLLVLDDVWRHDDAKIFENALGPRGRLLITTRDAGLVVSLKAQEHRIDVLSDAAAVRLLADWQEKPEETLPPQAQEVARECGNLPLALAHCGATVSGGTSWDDVLTALQQAKLDFVAPQEKIDGYAYRDVFASLRVSLDFLGAGNTVQHYLELAVFPAEWIPETAVVTLWRYSHGSMEGFSEIEARKLITTLHNKALIHRLEGIAPRRRILLHDLQRDYIQTLANARNSRDAHLQLLQAYGCEDRWHEGPDDGYYFQRLPFHMMEAGRQDDLRKILLDFDWLQNKLNATDVAALLADFDFFKEDSGLNALKESIRFSVHIIAQDKTQLAGQLLGRLAGHPSSAIQKLLQRAIGWRGATWLRPLTRNLSAPGDSIVPAVQGYTLTVVAVALKSGGAHAVAGSGAGTLQRLDLKHGSKRLIHAGGNTVNPVAITTGGDYAIAGFVQGVLQVWQLTSGRQPRLLKGKFGRVSALALTSDGRRAVSGSMDGTIQVWDLEKLVELQTMNKAGSVTALALSNDGKTVLSGSDTGTLKFWNADTGIEVRGWDGHPNRITALAMSSDGKIAVSGSADAALKIWDLRTFALKRTLEDHKGWIRAVVITPDGKRVVSGADDITVKIWNLKNRKAPATLWGHNGSVSAVALSPDGELAISASGDETYIVWNVKTGAQVHTLAGRTEWIRAATITKDGRLAVTGADDGKLTVWDLETQERVLVTTTGHGAWVNAVTATANGQYVVSGADDNKLKVWDLKTGEELATWEGHTNGITSAAVTPDGRQVISGSWDERIRVWDFKTGRSRLTRTHHRGWVRSVTVSPDGRHAASASYDNTIKLWDLKSLRPLRTFTGHRTWVTGVVFTPDGRRLASSSADETLKIWDVRSGNVLHTLEGHSGFVTSLAITNDGRRLVSASEDRTVKVWDLTTLKPLATFSAEGEIRACAVASDGVTVVASDSLGRVHFLRLEPAGSESRKGTVTHANR